MNQKSQPVQRTLEFVFRANPYLGYPRIKTFLDGVELPKLTIDTDHIVISVAVSDQPQKRLFELERYGKTPKHTALDSNGKIIADQYLELIDIKVDSISIPEFLIYTNTKFVGHNLEQTGCRVIGHNGIWSFEFETPIIQYVLDQKIINQAQSSDNYQYSWSFQLGPNSVNQMLEEIDTVTKKVQQNL